MFEANELYEKLQASDPGRAEVLKLQFVQTRDFPQLVQCVKTYVRLHEKANTEVRCKKNYVSFKRYYIGAGYAPDTVDEMWATGRDENGQRLKRTRNKKGEKCFVIEGDELETDKVGTRLEIAGVIGKAKLGAKDAATVLGSKRALEFADDPVGGHVPAPKAEPKKARVDDDEGEDDGSERQDDASEDGESENAGPEGGGSDSENSPDEDTPLKDAGSKSIKESPVPKQNGPNNSDDGSSSESESDSACITPVKVGRSPQSVGGGSGRSSSSKKLSARQAKASAKAERKKKKEAEARQLRKQELKTLKGNISAAKDLYKKAAHVWALRRTIRSYVELLVKGELVRGKWLPTFLLDCSKEFGHMQKVSALKLADVAKELQQSADVIDTWISSIDSWDFPCKFNVIRDDLFEKCDRWAAAVSEGRQHITALLGEIADTKHQSTSLNERWRKGRDRYRNWLDEWSLPPAVKKAYGDFCHAQTMDPDESKPHMKYDTPMEQRDEPLSMDSFSKPFLVNTTTTVPDEQKTQLEKAFQLFHSEHVTDVVARKYECQQQMGRDSLDASMGTVDVKTRLAFNANGAEPVVTEVAELRLLVHCMWANRCVLALEAQPLRAHPNFFVPFCGKFLVIVLPPSVLLEHSDISAFVNKCEPGDLSMYPTFLVEESQALWIPVGCVAVSCGIHPYLDPSKAELKLPPRKTKAGAEQKHCCAYGSYHVYDTTMLTTLASDAVRRCLASLWIRAQPHIFKSYRTSTGLAQWRALLAPEEPPKAEEAK